MSKKAELRVEFDMTSFRDGLRRLDRAVSGQIVHDAVDAGARLIQAHAKINANNVFSSKATNNLANSITVEIEKTLHGASANIGPTLVYGRIHELGGIIKPVHAKMLSWVVEKGETIERIFAKVVHMPARPYLRPAVEDNKSEIEDVIAATLRKGIEKAMQ